MVDENTSSATWMGTSESITEIGGDGKSLV